MPAWMSRQYQIGIISKLWPASKTDTVFYETIIKMSMGQKLALRGKRVSQLSFSPGLTP